MIIKKCSILAVWLPFSLGAIRKRRTHDKGEGFAKSVCAIVDKGEGGFLNCVLTHLPISQKLARFLE